MLDFIRTIRNFIGLKKICELHNNLFLINEPANKQIIYKNRTKNEIKTFLIN